MKPPPFRYHRPTSLEEVLQLLSEVGAEAAVLAGGQSLVPLLALRLAHPEHVVDVNALDGLDTFERDDGHLVVGALVRQEDALGSPTFAAACPLATAALPHVGVPETRARGTIVGSLTHADPAGELPTVAVTLGAELVLQSAAGTRTLAAEEFFFAPFLTARLPEELVTHVRLPTAGGQGFSFREVARGPFAVVGVAAALEVSPERRVTGARIGIGGVDGVVVRATDAEELLTGELLSDELATRAGEVAAAPLEPRTDALASGPYRRAAAAALVADALREAAEGTGAGA